MCSSKEIWLELLLQKAVNSYNFAFSKKCECELHIAHISDCNSGFELVYVNTRIMKEFWNIAAYKNRIHKKIWMSSKKLSISNLISATVTDMKHQKSDEVEELDFVRRALIGVQRTFSIRLNWLTFKWSCFQDFFRYWIIEKKYVSRNPYKENKNVAEMMLSENKPKIFG